MFVRTADFPDFGDTDHECTCCGRSLNNKRIAWLELNSRTGAYSKGGVGTSQSQGFFPFGEACARKTIRRAA